MKFKLVFSGLKVKNMEYAQSLRLTKTSKATSNIKIFGTVFMTWDKIPSQLLKSFVVSMPKRVFGVICKKKITQNINALCTWKNKYIKCFPSIFIWWSYNFGRAKFSLFYVPLNLIKIDENYVFSLVRSSCRFFMFCMSFR